ncbi:flagellar hook-associated protein FlgL [Roseateles sp.]|uniref:flagellar hook-associated protein FlgL n=1 Tax=Roseateles sp. TaxID=1971397 RepID=UPI0025D44F3C|nr:flagellar hook-associated protein FlgL [Roseateles sp.]MBV8034973.1 flagellar hook-associated protein FlgL [Roseateles sp.]
MRISTANVYEASISNLQRRQTALQQQQQQLTSGKRVLSASDDPTGAARAERALAAIGRVDANQRSLEASRNSMTLAESALGDAGELLQQARETMLNAGNASYPDTERASLAQKLKGLRDQLLAIANRTDGAGGYVFGGQGSAQPPFLDRNGGVTFIGVPGQIQSGNLEDFPLTMDGRGAWESARSGNGFFVTDAGTNSLVPGQAAKGWIDSGSVSDPSKLTGHAYSIAIGGTAPSQTYTITPAPADGTPGTGTFTPGKALEFDGMSMTISGAPVNGDNFSVSPSTDSLKVFDVLDRAISDLLTPNRGAAQITQSNNNAVRDLDAVMTRLQSARSQAGEALNKLDGSETRMSGLKLYSQQEQSAATDLDMTQAISDFSNQQTGYDAALKTYAMVQRMSLFQYING